MKLRFEVDQAACFRRGINWRTSMVTIEVDPAELPQEERDLIADRLDGIDICQLDGEGNRLYYRKEFQDHDGDWRNKQLPAFIIADSPDYLGMMKAIRADQASVKGKKPRENELAFADSKDIVVPVEVSSPKAKDQVVSVTVAPVKAKDQIINMSVSDAPGKAKAKR